VKTFPLFAARPTPGANQKPARPHSIARGDALRKSGEAHAVALEQIATLLENHLQAKIASEVQRLLQAAEPAIHLSRAARGQIRIVKRSSTIMISAAPAMIVSVR